MRVAPVASSTQVPPISWLPRWMVRRMTAPLDVLRQPVVFFQGNLAQEKTPQVIAVRARGNHDLVLCFNLAGSDHYLRGSTRDRVRT
jgi:hypothetical protein